MNQFFEINPKRRIAAFVSFCTCAIDLDNGLLCCSFKEQQKRSAKVRFAQNHIATIVSFASIVFTGMAVCSIVGMRNDHLLPMDTVKTELPVNKFLHICSQVLPPCRETT